MSILDAILQGIIQGLTEFLPVSSSGHLALYQHLFGKTDENGLFFSAVLHLGTLVAVFLAFRHTILALCKEFGSLCGDIAHKKFRWSTMNGERRMLFMLFLSLAVLIPLYPLKDVVETVTEKHLVVIGFCFLYTAAILYLSDRCVHGKKKPKDITVKNALTVGIFQGIALFPGISRSGSTIASGLFCSFSRDTAVKYSFILGIPTILAGCLLEFKDAAEAGIDIQLVPLLVGFVVSALVGICAIRMVSWLLKSNRFKIFAIYTLLLGLIVLGVCVYETIK